MKKKMEEMIRKAEDLILEKRRELLLEKTWDRQLCDKQVMISYNNEAEMNVFVNDRETNENLVKELWKTKKKNAFFGFQIYDVKTFNGSTVLIYGKQWATPIPQKKERERIFGIPGDVIVINYPKYRFLLPLPHKLALDSMHNNNLEQPCTECSPEFLVRLHNFPELLLLLRWRPYFNCTNNHLSERGV